MIFFQIVIFLGALLVFVLSSYLLVLTFGAWVFKKVTKQETMPLSMAVVIPAHNEESLLKDTLDSISKSEYQLSLVDIFVIADNCSDATAEIARTAKAQVFERNDPEHKGKGEALDWFFREYESVYKNHEAVVLIDADTIVDKHFLSHISASLSHQDVQVVQGFYGVSNPEESWRTRLSTAALNVFHHVRPAGRNAFGGSAGLKGNGMAFKADILQRYHWPSHSIVEDLEFSTQLLLDDIIVHYNPEAVVLGEMPAQKEPVTTQRVRWEGGRLQILREYGLELLKKCVHKKRFVYFDGFMEIILPPLTILVSGQLILLFLACLFFQSLIFDAILCLLVSLVYVLSGMILRNAPVSIWLSFVGAPLFIIWKLFLYVTNLPWKDSKQWIRTKRHSEIRKR